MYTMKTGIPFSDPRDLFRDFIHFFLFFLKKKVSEGPKTEISRLLPVKETLESVV